MKKSFISLLVVIAIICLNFNVYAINEDVYNEQNDTDTQGVVSYDAITGIETYEQISYESVCNSEILTDSNNSVLSTPEVVSNVRENIEYLNDEEEVIGESILLPSKSQYVGINSIYNGDGSGDNRWKVSTPSNYGQYRNTCRLIINLSNGSTALGTGFVLSDSAIVTAGHCVYDYYTGKWAKSIRVIPAYENGLMPYGSAMGTSFSCGSAWKDSGDAQQDWGVIHVNNSFPSKCGYLGLRYQSNTYVDTYFYLAGYPGRVGDHLQTEVNGNYMYCGFGKVTWNSSSVVSYTELDTSEGQSGAPVMKYYSDTGYTAVAIHRGTYNGRNSGVRLSEWLFNYLMSYR